MASGVHRVVVTDAMGCSGLVDVTVVSTGGYSISVATTPATCPGVSNGTVTASPMGGSAPYNYSLNYGTPQASSLFTNVPGGQNTIIVTDANNCTDSVQFTIAVGSGLSVAASTSPATCGQFNGTITISVSNGTAPYAYGLNFSTTQSSPILSGVNAGNQFYTVSDALGCSVTQSVMVVETPITATVTVTQPTCVSQGSILVTSPTGSAPFLYSLNNGTLQNGPSFTNLVAGTYGVLVQDANMCTYTETVTINASPASVTPSVSTIASASTICEGDPVTFTATPTNGGANPQFQWTVNGVNVGTNTAAPTIHTHGCVYHPCEPS
ncbi:hypothetical protein EON64_13800, partial [archaeon]